MSHEHTCRFQVEPVEFSMVAQPFNLLHLKIVRLFLAPKKRPFSGKEKSCVVTRANFCKYLYNLFWVHIL